MPNIQALYQLYLSHPNISTDTRNIAEGCIFFALKGENFNANTFAKQALAKGAAYVVIDEAAYQHDERCILVPDVLTALQALAKHHRHQLTIPVIGLTGSNGKTTTKELIKAVLSEKYKVFATHGNLNNHIGVALSILSIKTEVEIAVIEMGANHQREIEFLCSIAQPTHGLITNIGMAHLDGFGGFEGVKKGKAELYAYLKANNGQVFIYRNNPYLLEMSHAANLLNMIYYGTGASDQISGTLVKADPLLAFTWTADQQSHEVQVNLTGSYNFENCLAAICIGDYFNLSPEQINRGLSNYIPSNNRSQLTRTADNTLICDFYNANPSSMQAAIDNLSGLSGQNKVAILGDMFELGQEAEQQHELIVEKAAQAGLDQTIFIGKHFNHSREAYPSALFFSTSEEAAEYIQANPFKDSLILLKGSRGMALERLMPKL